MVAPGIGILSVDMAMPGPTALYGPAEMVAYEAARCASVPRPISSRSKRRFLSPASAVRSPYRQRSAGHSVEAHAYVTSSSHAAIALAAAVLFNLFVVIATQLLMPDGFR